MYSGTSAKVSSTSQAWLMKFAATLCFSDMKASSGLRVYSPPGPQMVAQQGPPKMNLPRSRQPHTPVDDL
jgi:hypothetical protein